MARVNKTPGVIPMVVTLDDSVNHPPHYTQGDIECIDAIKAALGQDGFIAFLRGQIIRYQWRLLFKGNAAEDARKAGWYSDRLIHELSSS